jgi:hypothetical protein
MRNSVLSLTEAQSKNFCLHLWFELTIAGRGVWSDTNQDAASQLNSLKWLNEIHHRVWNAHASSKPDAMALLLNRIIDHCENAPELRFPVRVALDRALAKVGAAKSGPAPERA